MKTQIRQVDAFTAKPFHGNPAAVCLLREQAPDAWMQAVAAEMNLSETAFLWSDCDGFSIRYFTPLVQVPLCGHATLASAHVLWEDGLVAQGTPIPLYAKASPLKASWEEGWICLDFPAYPVSPSETPSELARALGTEPLSTEHGSNGYLVRLPSEEAVRSLQPDFALMRKRQLGWISVTAASASPRYDFVSRFFAPEVGIDEDPVTGVAHCSLGPYWAGQLGKDDLVGHQVSRRGGVVRVRVRGERVDILGQAVTVMRGEMVV